MDFPKIIIFKWDGCEAPFQMLYLIDLDPQDFNGKWITGILAPKSRFKLRNLKGFPDYGVSLFGKVHKGIK